MRFFRIFASGIVLIMLAGCSMNDIDTKVETNGYQTDYSNVSIESLIISYPKDEKFAVLLNQEAKENLEKRLSGFEEDAKESVDIRPEGAKAEFATKQLVKYAKNDFLSALEEEYTYISGAHGMTVWNAQNIDFRSKKRIYLDDLFADENYETVLNNMINTLIENNPEEYADLWEEAKIQEEHQYNFYITDDDLVIYFLPYELSYYARGFVEFPLRLSELKGYMKEEYYFIAQNKNE